MNANAQGDLTLEDQLQRVREREREMELGSKERARAYIPRTVRPRFVTNSGGPSTVTRTESSPRVLYAFPSLVFFGSSSDRSPNLVWCVCAACQQSAYDIGGIRLPCALLCFGGASRFRASVSGGGHRIIPA